MRRRDHGSALGLQKAVEREYVANHVGEDKAVSQLLAGHGSAQLTSERCGANHCRSGCSLRPCHHWSTLLVGGTQGTRSRLPRARVVLRPGSNKWARQSRDFINGSSHLWLARSYFTWARPSGRKAKGFQGSRVPVLAVAGILFHVLFVC